MDVLLWLENTGFATWVRESNSILAYPGVLFLHTLGLATVAGISGFFSLRVLGFAPGLPFASLKPFVTLAWAAFVVTAGSGTALLIANASAKVQSPIFLVKMVFVLLAVVSLHLMTRRALRTPQVDETPLPRDLSVLAALSLVFWVGATTAGRLMAYIV